MTAQHRAAYDRRQRAWVFAVLGLLAAWVGLGVVAQDAAVWKVVGAALVTGGLLAVARGITLFQQPRP